MVFTLVVMWLLDHDRWTVPIVRASMWPVLHFLWTHAPANWWISAMVMGRLKLILATLQCHPYRRAVGIDWMASELHPIVLFAHYYKCHHVFDIVLKLANKMVAPAVDRMIRVMFDVTRFSTVSVDFFPKSLCLDCKYSKHKNQYKKINTKKNRLTYKL